MSRKVVPQIAKDLMNARALISDKKRWCQGLLRRPKAGNTAYCAMGALIEVTRGHDVHPKDSPEETENYRRALRRLDRLAMLKYDNSVSRVNDLKGHEAVLELFDQAISQVMEEQNAS